MNTPLPLSIALESHRLTFTIDGAHHATSDFYAWGPRASTQALLDLSWVILEQLARTSLSYTHLCADIYADENCEALVGPLRDADGYVTWSANDVLGMVEAWQRAEDRFWNSRRDPSPCD